MSPLTSFKGNKPFFIYVNNYQMPVIQYGINHTIPGESDFRSLLATSTQLIKTNLISAEGIENLSAHEAVLAIKMFAISLKLRMKHYESKSETALPDDIRKHGQKLIHHYATEMLYHFNKIQKYLALPSRQDRNTLHATLHCIRNLAKYQDGELDKRYILLSPLRSYLCH